MHSCVGTPITQQEFVQKIAEERATYQEMLNPTAH